MPRFASLALALASAVSAAAAQRSPAAARDPMQEGLPLRPTRMVDFNAKTGHWMSVDVSPDGQTLVFDHLGDLYTMPIAGGKATPITRGMGFDSQPRFSPDGKRIVFVSDRDGGWNVWTISVDRKDTVQVTRGKSSSYHSPEWTPDGNYIVVTRGSKLQLYHKDGGQGQQLIREPQALRTSGAAFGADPRYIWFAQRFGTWLYNSPGRDYQLAVYDRETGQTAVRTNRYGSAFRPTLSPDGRWLVYGTRHIADTQLRLRDLKTGDERWLATNVQRDDQESAATLDVYPGMSFTPDSKFLIATWDGKLWKVPVASEGPPVSIPIDVDVHLALGPAVAFQYPMSDSARFVVKQIRDAVPSPDGRKLAFVSLDRLYVMDWPRGTPQRVSAADIGEYEPAWSPDGLWLVYTTYSTADGGHLYRVRVGAPQRGQAARPQRLTATSALYRQPVYSPDGRRVVAMRGPVRAYLESVAGGAPGGEDIVWVPVGTVPGEAHLIAPSGGLANPQFSKDTSRIYAYSSGRGVVSMRWDGTDIKSHLRVTGGAPPDAPPGEGRGGTPASVVFFSPDGTQALAQVQNDLFVVSVPYVGGTEPTINVGNPANASFPVRKLTEIGGQFPAWSGDGRRVHWSIGNAHIVYDLDRAKAFDDSVRVATRGRPAGDTTRTARATFTPEEVRIRITAERDIPRGVVVLRGARAITMKGNEIIENADIVVRDNRIAAIGARGQVQVPPGARVIDVSGKTIMPGFVDTHAHVRATFDIHRDQVWSYAANLAYGVTTLRDPQTGTTDVLSYEDQVTAGRILGPRIYSTGPGVFGAENIRDLDHARRILKRYSDYYDTHTIKEYTAGNREQRQWIIEAARELRLMPTTEGALDIKMNVTEAFDGYSGHEHTWPTYPIQPDLLKLFSESKIMYTPTIIVAYGGPWAENYYYETEDLLGNEKLQHFTPWEDLEGKILRRGGQPGAQGGPGQAGWFRPEVHVFKKIGEQVKDYIAAGGRVGVGSHGQLQGLGYHWELWSIASGGLSNHDALRVATIMGASGLGLDKDVGSLETGKMADLLVLDRNPLENIRNSNSIRFVMKNGRLYDGGSLDEIWPRDRKVAPFYWLVDR